MVSNAHISTVQDSTVIIEKRMLTHHNAMPVVAMKGRTDGRRRRNARNKLLYDFTITVIIHHHVLQMATQLFGMRKTGSNLWVCKGILLLCAHLFKFCLHLIKN